MISKSAKKLDPMDGLTPSYVPTKQDKAIIKFLVGRRYKQFKYCFFKESSFSSQHNVNWMISLGQTLHGPQVYYPVAEFVKEQLTPTEDQWNPRSLSISTVLVHLLFDVGYIINAGVIVANTNTSRSNI